ncbi:MAG: pyridoxal-phosphate dependent enzyme [Sphingobacteriaceae bacterium]|nr:pyridoxal-phosphate dependent enzyme [Sphingobacteriaceae bacterium]
MKQVNYINTLNLNGQEISVLRLDLIHPKYGGNKIFKLKYNILKAKEAVFKKVLTFGGAHSNHIFSSAAYCKDQELDCIGVIRGREAELENSPTLVSARQNGMQFHFVSNADFQNKDQADFIQQLKEKFGDFYLVPEGGNNAEGVKGCMEIMNDELKKYDYVFCASGTGATYSGIKISAAPHQKIIGVSVLKGENTLIDSANKWLSYFGQEKINSDECLNSSTIINTYALNGYATFSPDLFHFKKEFEEKFNIPLDHVYTAKLFYAVSDLIKKKDILLNKKILVIHSGGQQGNAAFEKRYRLS